ncbi:MFS transporter [Penicillium citrinum]|uniref:MFS transporter n=2 Tax=Penicillium TaxID=5073 RepID=A0A9W9TDU2_PENCI|nr:MFS transporter [Penicillium citrinum]KAJ5217865.1 MFS transporter [Penicillium citrinum]KAJ5575252.1 MFS transporter [Penicillium hetheringtonii]
MPGSKAADSDHVEFTVNKDVTGHSAGRIPTFMVGLTEEEREKMEKKLVRKIDARLLIMIVIMYILNYLDRNNIASAKLAGMDKDLNLKGNQYQFGKPSIYLPGCMFAWGTISAATAATKSFGGLLACRFILGFVEAAYFPGCLYLLSAWYTRKELGKRTALLYSGSLLSGAFSGLIAAGITNGLAGAQGIAAWRWLFIIEGVITVFVALLAAFIIPDLPRTTSWLTDREKEFAAWRLEADIGEEDWVDSQHQSMFHGAKLAFTDYKTWLLLGAIYGCTSAGAVTTFFPIVMAGLGKGTVDTLLLTTPPYLIGTIVVLINAWHADKTGERYLHIALPPVVAIIAFIIPLANTSFAARYVAMCLMIGGIYAGYVSYLALLQKELRL